MGSIFDKNVSAPEKGPYIWIKFKADGVVQRKPIGRVKPAGLTKAQVRTREKELRRLAADVLAKIEGDIVAGRYGLEDASRPTSPPRFFADVATAWVERRRKANERDPMVHRAWRDDRCRVNRHLKPFFGRMRVDRVGPAEVKRFIAAKRGGLARQTIVNCLSLLSRMYNDLKEEGEAVINPVAQLDRATRRAIGPRRDPRSTPFLRQKANIRAVHLALEEPVQVMFDVGVFAGLRTGEIQALEPEDIDLGRRRIVVARSVGGPLKDNDIRVVPILDSLMPVLRSWMVRHPGSGPLFPPTRGGGRYMRKQTLHRHLRKALKACDLPVELTWYQCTRHTFASHWVMDGRPIEKLQEILGHSSVTVTERYAHLSPEMFTEADFAAVAVDLSQPQVLPLGVRKEDRKR